MWIRWNHRAFIFRPNSTDEARRGFTSMGLLIGCWTLPMMPTSSLPAMLHLGGWSPKSRATAAGRRKSLSGALGNGLVDHPARGIEQGLDPGEVASRGSESREQFFLCPERVDIEGLGHRVDGFEHHVRVAGAAGQLRGLAQQNEPLGRSLLLCRSRRRASFTTPGCVPIPVVSPGAGPNNQPHDRDQDGGPSGQQQADLTRLGGAASARPRRCGVAARLPEELGQPRVSGFHGRGLGLCGGPQLFAQGPVVGGLLLRAQQAEPGRGHLVEQSLRWLALLARLESAQMDHALVGSVVDGLGLVLEGLEPQQAVVVGRLLLGSNPQPGVVRIERPEHRSYPLGQ